VDEENRTFQFLYKGEETEQIELLKKAVLNDIQIVSFKETETNLEDVFMEITKGVTLT
jgi:ABC-2 type transport system ATP-binding protein